VAATLTLDGIQERVAALQTALYRYEGSLDKVILDDKGLSALAAFGLPPMTHEDDAVRAVLASVELDAMLREFGSPPSIGVATGRVFSGGLGAVSRRDHTVLGSTVNLSARLMAAAGGTVLCDAPTARRAMARFPLERREGTSLKGLRGRVDAFEPSEEWWSAVGTGSVQSGQFTAVKGGPGLVGRWTELDRIAQLVDELRQGRGSALVLRGEAGIGKTALIHQLMERAQKAGVVSCLGRCSGLHVRTPWFASRGLVRAVLQLGDLPEVAARTARVAGLLAEGRPETGQAALLNPVLGLELPEHGDEPALAGLVRRDNTADLLHQLLLAGGSWPRLLVIEDVHWLDSASWSLVERLVDACRERPMALVLSTRPRVEGDGQAAERVFGSKRVDVLELEGLSDGEIQALGARMLGAEHLAPVVGRLVAGRARGNPFFGEEIVRALAQAAMVKVDHGVASLTGRTRLADVSVLPDSISGVITSRIDRLPAATQFTLKAASVLGEQVDVDLLLALHPAEPEPDELQAQLADLVTQGLLTRIPGERSLRFRHAITRDVTYQLLLFDQRRRLHHRVATLLEAEDPVHIEPGLLLHHWRKADAPREALAWVDPAGDAAMKEGNHLAAADVFDWGIRQLEGHPELDTSSRLAWWATASGEAEVALGRHRQGRARLELALKELGHPVPVRVGSLVLAAGLEALRQLLHRLVPNRLVRSRPPRWPVLRAAACCYEQLGYVHYAASETLLGVHAALQMLNLAERAGPSPVLARAFAAMGLTASVTPMQGAAGHYDRKARRVADGLRDPSTTAYVHWIAGIVAAGEGRWDALERDASLALEQATARGDHRLVVMTLHTLATGVYLQGDPVRAMELAERQLEVSRVRGNRLWEAWGLNSMAEASLARGDAATAIRSCERALSILATESDHTEEIEATGLLAQALLVRGRQEEALRFASSCLDMVERAEITAFNTLDGFVGPVEVLLAVAERTEVSPTLQRDLRRAFRQLRRFTSVFAVGRPAAARLEARLQRLRGRRRAARRLLARAIRTARRLALPLEAARSLLDLSGLRPDGSDLVERARALAEQAGAEGLLGKVEDTARQLPPVPGSG